MVLMCSFVVGSEIDPNSLKTGTRLIVCKTLRNFSVNQDHSFFLVGGLNGDWAAAGSGVGLAAACAGLAVAVAPLGGMTAGNFGVALDPKPPCCHPC